MKPLNFGNLKGVSGRRKSKKSAHRDRCLRIDKKIERRNNKVKLEEVKCHNIYGGQLKAATLSDKIKFIVDEIIEDILNRSGLGDEWEQIDKDIQEEIKEKWCKIINETLEESK